jgi:hypothetical protein
VEADAMSEDLLNKDSAYVRSFLLLDLSSSQSVAAQAATAPAVKKAAASRAEDGVDMNKMKRRSSFMLAGTVTSKFKTQLAGISAMRRKLHS